MDDVSVVKTFIFEAAMDQYSPRLNAFLSPISFNFHQNIWIMIPCFSMYTISAHKYLT